MRLFLKFGLIILLMVGSFVTYSQKKEVVMDKMQSAHFVRIAEIEVFPEYWNQYKEILINAAKESVLKEEGVISIFPMEIESDPNKIRILEIYRDQKAYEDHIKSEHFQYYKTNTLKMIKDLKLIDMKALDLATMGNIFVKENRN